MRGRVTRAAHVLAHPCDRFPKVDDAIDRKEFAAIASFGLKIWLELAIEADERHLPMILD